MVLTLGERLRQLPGPVLVTGHTGFKGMWLTLLLERLNVPVVGFSLPAKPFSLYERAHRVGAIPEVFADIRNFDLVDAFMKEHRPSAIFHLAAQPLVLESYKSPRETFETNVMGTVNILEAAFNSESVAGIVVVTTDKVYRNDNSGVRFTETDALAGKDPYSASKVAAEAAVAAWQQMSAISGGPKVLAVRAGNVIGGGDWAEDRLIPDLIRGFASNSEIIVRNPSSTRPWQHVLDPLTGYVMAMEAALKGDQIRALNFGPDSESLSVKEVVHICTEEWPLPTKVIFKDVNLQVDAEAVALELDSSKARSTLGWRSVWSQSESVTATIKWWDEVLNQSASALDACDADIDFMLAKVRSLGNS